MATTYDRAQLRQSLTPIHTIDGTIVRFSAFPSIKNVALDIAAGVGYSLAWMIDHEHTAYLGITTASGNRVSVAFTSPNHDVFLQTIGREGYFVIAVEGCIPAPVTMVGKNALTQYLAHQGWD